MSKKVIMTKKEVDRIKVLEKLCNNQLTHEQSSKLLGVSKRHSIRLKKEYIKNGAEGLIHKLRGQTSNRKVPESEINKVIDIIKNDYWDFKPTLAHEKLTERGLISFSVERLRQAMIDHDIHKPKIRKKDKNHPARDRRPCVGELIQIDGSPHKWFEDRAPKCTLIAYIDDATSSVLYAKFVESESTWAYFDCTNHYLNLYGKPLAFYSDKHGVFRINSSKDGSASASDSHGYTQFGRALNELGIEIIHANSPEAKGRIERLFKTLQDRLVKELRLKNISSMEDANNFIAEYLDTHNNRFSVQPTEDVDMHQPLTDKDNLEEIFTKQHTRILSKTLTCQYDNKIYQIKTDKPSYMLRNAKVIVKEANDGTVAIYMNSKRLEFSVITINPKVNDTDIKELNILIDEVKSMRKPHKPAANHPWKRTYNLTKQKIKRKELAHQR